MENFPDNKEFATKLGRQEKSQKQKKGHKIHPTTDPN
jgi:hypothetical protein